MNTRVQLLSELSAIEHQLKRANYADGFRVILDKLNKFSSPKLPADLIVRAKYFFLQAVLFEKAARKQQAGWLGSSVDCLQYALERFTDADQAIKKHASTNGWSKELEQLQQACAYEAVATATVLQLWGERFEPEVAPDTGCLSPELQRKAASALRHKHSLPSRF